MAKNSNVDPNATVTDPVDSMTETVAAAVLAPVMSESQFLLARRIAVDAFESCTGEPQTLDSFNALVLKDHRLDNCEPEEISAIAQRAVECFHWWVDNGITHPSKIVDAIPRLEKLLETEVAKLVASEAGSPPQSIGATNGGQTELEVAAASAEASVPAPVVVESKVVA